MKKAVLPFLKISPALRQMLDSNPEIRKNAFNIIIDPVQWDFKDNNCFKCIKSLNSIFKDNGIFQMFT
jgi:hypothetical protein